MLRRARSQSTEDVEDGGKKADGAAAAASKRKLSVGEPQKASKKAKKASEVDQEEDDAEEDSGDKESASDDEGKGDDEEDDEDEGFDYGDDDEDDEDDVPERDDSNSKAYQIDGPGPYVFFLWADAIHGVLRTGPLDDVPYVVLKSAAMDAFAPVASLSEDDDIAEAIEEHLEVVKTWRIISVKDAAKSPQAKMLQKLWRKLTKESHARKESGERAGWWYEVLAQREKPEEGKPGIEVKLEGTGTWWFADIQPTDDAGHKAMSCVVDFTAQNYD